jgi:hypothetical protein
VEDYGIISSNISTKQPIIIIIIVGHLPGFLIKSTPKRFGKEIWKRDLEISIDKQSIP